MFHAFFAHVLLLNYLVAILSTTYENMKQTGIFKYKVNLFNYSDRYLVAYKDEVYGELVIHPAPLNYFLVPLTMFLAC
jgi:hypothetical protein